MSSSVKLFFLCGKMASGKSTLARELALRNGAVLLAQDEFLGSLFPGEITDIPSFVEPLVSPEETRSRRTSAPSCPREFASCSTSREYQDSACVVP